MAGVVGHKCSDASGSIHRFSSFQLMYFYWYVTLSQSSTLDYPFLGYVFPHCSSPPTISLKLGYILGFGVIEVIGKSGVIWEELGKWVSG